MCALITTTSLQSSSHIYIHHEQIFLLFCDVVVHFVVFFFFKNITRRQTRRTKKKHRKKQTTKFSRFISIVYVQSVACGSLIFFNLIWLLRAISKTISSIFESLDIFKQQQFFQYNLHHIYIVLSISCSAFVFRRAAHSLLIQIFRHKHKNKLEKSTFELEYGEMLQH